MRVFTVRSSSRDPEATYMVRLYVGIETEYGANEWECTCAHYHYRHTHCRHIDIARSAFADGCSGGTGTNPFPLTAPHSSAAHEQRQHRTPKRRKAYLLEENLVREG